MQNQAESNTWSRRIRYARKRFGGIHHHPDPSSLRSIPRHVVHPQDSRAVGSLAMSCGRSPALESESDTYLVLVS